MKYQVQDTQGNMHIIDGPEGASPDEVIAQAQKLIPQQQKPPVDWMNVVGNAAKDVFQRPASMAKDLGTNPVTMARALPPLMGAAGVMSPIPGGATMLTVGGRQLSNIALKALGKPEYIPSGLSQVAEGGLAALGDIGIVPGIKKGIFGNQIGKAESLAGLDLVPKEAPPSGMRTAVKFVQSLKDKALSIEEAKQMKPAVDTIFQKGWLRGTQYEPDAVAVSQKIQQTLNQVPGRQAAAQGMARAMTIPRGINKAYNMIPPSVKKGLGYGTGVGLAGGTAFSLIKKLLGG